MESGASTYRPGPLPEISLSVAGAEVTPEAFHDYTSRLADAEPVDGLGDAATYSTAQGSLRVLAGSTLFVIQVRHHPQPREAAITAAQRALANFAPQPPLRAAPESSLDRPVQEVPPPGDQMDGHLWNGLLQGQATDE